MIEPKIASDDLFDNMNLIEDMIKDVTHITDEAVQNYNKVIRENADKFIIINWQ